MRCFDDSKNWTNQQDFLRNSILYHQFMLFLKLFSVKTLHLRTNTDKERAFFERKTAEKIPVTLRFLEVMSVVENLLTFTKCHIFKKCYHFTFYSLILHTGTYIFCFL